MVPTKSAEACCSETCCGGGRGADRGAAPSVSDVRRIVRDRYAAAAMSGESCCMGRGQYTEAELADIPRGSDLGLGTGNPVAAAGVRPGERVLDLGCGAGVDVFLASRRTGAQGRVIGVDMTEEMIDLCRKFADEGGFGNVEFRRGLIESPPVEPGTFDLVISNCVINLSTDKDAVFQAAFAALKPGGRLLVSDIAFDVEPSAGLRSNLQAYCVCVAGADLLDRYLARIERAGFIGVEVLAKSDGERIAGESAQPLKITVRARRAEA